MKAEDHSRRLFLDYRFRIDPDSISCSKVDLSERKTEKEYQEMSSEIALVRDVGKATDDLSRVGENSVLLNTMRNASNV